MFERNALGSNARKMSIQYSSFTLKIIAAVCTVIGTIGVAILQNGVMNLGEYSTATLLEGFENNGKLFAFATIIILCSAVASIAVPIYSHLLIEGFNKTSSVKKYAIRILILAVVSEIPYDLAMQEKFFSMNSQNPVFGLLIAIVMIYFLNYFEQTKKFAGVLLKFFIVFAAVMWAAIFGVKYGITFILVTAIMWLLEGQGALTTFLAVIASLLSFPAPIGFVFNYFYNGDKGKGNRMIFYVLYPAQLLILGLIGKFLLN